MMKLWIGLILLPFALIAQEPPAIIGELGCAACHPGLPMSKLVTVRSGSLADINARMKPVELYEYLQNPRQRKEDIGSTRMPDYRFTAQESLALTLFLTGSDKGLEQLTASHTNVTA